MSIRRDLVATLVLSSSALFGADDFGYGPPEDLPKGIAPEILAYLSAGDSFRESELIAKYPDLDVRAKDVGMSTALKAWLRIPRSIDCNMRLGVAVLRALTGKLADSDVPYMRRFLAHKEFMVRVFAYDHLVYWYKGAKNREVLGALLDRMFADPHPAVKDRCLHWATYEELYAELAPVFDDWLRKASDEEKKKDLYKTTAAFVREAQRREDLKLIRGEPASEDQPKKE